MDSVVASLASYSQSIGMTFDTTLNESNCGYWSTATQLGTAPYSTKQEYINALREVISFERSVDGYESSYADALAGASLAEALNAPIYLVSGDTLDPKIEQSIYDMHGKKYIHTWRRVRCKQRDRTAVNRQRVYGDKDMGEYPL